jgi:hypothetical protein
MPALHVSEELLDQYSIGSLPEELLPEVEEHVLACEACQSRLKEADDFREIFRAAAVLPEARPHRSWWRAWRRPVAVWAAAAGFAASLIVVVANRHESPSAPAIAMLQSLRGPETSAQVPAGKPVVLMLDVAPLSQGAAYETRIVDPLGSEVFRGAATNRDGHPSVLVNKLARGAYWIRVYRGKGELVAEYGLEAR